MRTLGIDLAAQPENTAACVIDWPNGVGGRVDIMRPQAGYDDQQLLEPMKNADAVAIDAPFGWPELINAHLGEYAARGVWPLRPDDEGAEEWIVRLCYRETRPCGAPVAAGAQPADQAVAALGVLERNRGVLLALRCAAPPARPARGQFLRPHGRAKPGLRGLLGISARELGAAIQGVQAWQPEQ